MYSSNDKLIDEVKQRLLSVKKKRPISNYLEGGVRYVEVRRLSSLIQRKGSENKRCTIRKKTNINYLNEDKINLRLVPVMKSAKAIFRFTKNNDNNKINNKIDSNKALKTEINDINNSRNKLFFNISKKYSSNIYMKTISNILSTSNSFGKAKTISRKNIFFSPFQEGKKRSKIFKILVDFSKEIHSNKHKENNLINNIVNINSFKTIKENEKIKNKKFEIFSQEFSLKRLRIKDDIKIENEKNNKKNGNNSKENQKTKFLLNRLNNENEIIKNKMKNKKKKIRPNCYYNKLHLNKINDIIEKYSYNNID